MFGPLPVLLIFAVSGVPIALNGVNPLIAQLLGYAKLMQMIEISCDPNTLAHVQDLGAPRDIGEEKRQERVDR